ncbi:DNA-binding transcriptional LysR family regulator [Kribbella voronezhensis]|uniref:DNA-binding transcriptional LysR family regulator n=1 Tax=Kribbella voronezhensis TaxID=2512212 RepID=A0A4R7SXY2_9ACTN|nr:LysR family transcriptional regulator [Kribbella voronezhensis]TDU83566.1 DNA-binding transcriptional LysR family regulator [Kribbella voronezhensis]
MAEIELRELRLFLVLAEELHFGRAAERLGLTTSRASQTLRALERKLGGRRLFERTSRVVTLTAAGQALRDELAPVVTGLDTTLTRARTRAAGPGTIRLGVLNAASGTLVLNAAITLFEEAHEGAAVRLVATPLNDRLGPLRRREVDLSVTRLPLDQPDIVIGPLLSKDDRRVVMVAGDHPLAGRREVSVEDFADYPVRRPADVPELAEAACPSYTPSGRAIVPSDIEVNDVSELLLLIAQGRLVHPTVAPFAEHFRHPGIAIVPVRDLPPSSTALAWLDGYEHPARDLFVATVELVVAAHPRT